MGRVEFDRVSFRYKEDTPLIDELSLGLAPIVVEQLLDVVRALRDQGTTVILVEQSVNIALTIRCSNLGRASW